MQHGLQQITRLVVLWRDLVEIKFVGMGGHRWQGVGKKQEVVVGSEKDVASYVGDVWLYVNAAIITTKRRVSVYYSGVGIRTIPG